VGRALVETGASGEGNACVKATSLDQPSICALDFVANVHDLHAGFDDSLGVFAYLSVTLCSFAQVIQVIKRELLFRG